MARLALSLETLRAQVNAIAPKRNKRSDGWIGDAAHSARRSDHNPNAAGVVCALDITHDPDGGMDCRDLAAVLSSAEDPRIAYLIWNGLICSGEYSSRAWRWREYTGTNPHKTHLHISVVQDAAKYDDSAPWALDGLERVPILTVGGKQFAMMRDGKGVTYAPVRALAEALGATVHYDPKTGNVTVTK